MTMRVGVRHLNLADQDTLWTRACTGELPLPGPLHDLGYDPRRPHQDSLPQSRLVRRSDKRRWLRRLREIQLVAHDALEQSDRRRAIEVLCEMLPLALAVEMTTGRFYVSLATQGAHGHRADLLIIDDPCVETSDVNRQVMRWYSSTLPGCPAQNCHLAYAHYGDCLIGETMVQALGRVVRLEYNYVADFSKIPATLAGFYTVRDGLQLRLDANLHPRWRECLIEVNVVQTEMARRADLHVIIRDLRRRQDYEFILPITRR